MERLQESCRHQDCKYSGSGRIQGERGVCRGEERATIPVQQGYTSVARAPPIAALGFIEITRKCNEGVGRITEGIPFHALGGW